MTTSESNRESAAYRPGGEIVLIAHDPRWRDEFHRAAEELRGVVTRGLVDIQHIGSTAIPGIVAKPVIDILLLVTDLDSLDGQSSRIEALGYHARGEFGIRGRRYFSRTSAEGVRLHQIHAFAEGADEAARHLMFRDYLRTHLDAARAYDALKRELAIKYEHDVEAYANAKTDFIMSVLDKARTAGATG